MAASRCVPMRVGSLRQMVKYSTSVRHSVRSPRHHRARSERSRYRDSRTQRAGIAVPAMVLGQLVGVLVARARSGCGSATPTRRFSASSPEVVASAIEIDAAQERAHGTASVPHGGGAGAEARGGDVDRDGVCASSMSTGALFLDGDYLIKGVAGRILWVLLGHYERDGREEFTNKEVG